MRLTFLRALSAHGPSTLVRRLVAAGAGAAIVLVSPRPDHSTQVVSAPAPSAMSSVTRPMVPTGRSQNQSSGAAPKAKEPAISIRRASTLDVGNARASRIAAARPGSPLSHPA